LTNHFQLPPATVCSLYKSRWQVELFFKWIKQHLRIKTFLGTSENAVKTQIWIAISVYLLFLRPSGQRDEGEAARRRAVIGTVKESVRDVRPPRMQEP
jgi:hypothetical protein